MSIKVRRFASLVVMAFCMMFSSCIKDEALSTEADILSCTVDGDILIRQPGISNDRISLYVSTGIALDNLAPRFEVSNGATLSPAGGTTRDFTTPQIYRVTSQDGAWFKDYTVSFIQENMPTVFHFENAELYNNRYYVFKENDMTWASGNAGFAITAGNAAADSYPTSQAADGYQGKCAKLVTRSTGILGATFGSPIAAGNLYTGSFVLDITNTLRSTHFGVPFMVKPKALTGYYKYTPGAVYTEGTTVVNKEDSCDIYAVLYEVTDNVPYLDGTNIKTSPNIVMMAQIEGQGKPTDWTRFEIPFVSVAGREIDEIKLAAGKYSLAIVFSSSKGGAEFKGAVGSTLYIDEVRVSIDY